MSRRHQQRISQLVRNDLRGAIALYQYAAIMQMGDLTNAKIEKLMQNQFIGAGQDGAVSNAHLTATAQGVWEGLYERNDSGVPVLNPIYHRTAVSLRAGIEITRPVLERKNFNGIELCSGRLLTDAAKTVLKNIKKAMSVFRKHFKEDGTPLRSGDNEEKAVDALLQDLFKEMNSAFNCETIVIDATTQDGNNDSVEDGAVGGAVPAPDANNSQVSAPDNAPTANRDNKMPEGWTFLGYLAFRFFGPFSANKAAGRELDLLGLTDPVDKASKKYGRNAARKEMSKAEEFERARDRNRGKTPLELVLLEMRASSNARARTSFEEGKIFLLQIEAERHAKMMGLYLQMNREDKFLEEEKKYLKVTQEITKAREDMEDIKAMVLNLKGKKKRRYGEMLDESIDLEILEEEEAEAAGLGENGVANES